MTSDCFRPGGRDIGVVAGLILASQALFAATAQTSTRAEPAWGPRVDALFAPWTKEPSGGALVVVTHNGEIVFERGYGYADLERRVAIDGDTVFHIASDSKVFTAAAVCRLAERGRLGLDDPLAKHIPEMRAAHPDITLRHLLQHTSGLRDQWSLLAMAGWRPEDLVSQDQVLRLLARQRELNFPPGTQQQYSNSGYTLLAEVVARVSGVSFDAFLAREFFEPLDMRQTACRCDVQRIVPHRALSYARGNDKQIVERPVQYSTFGATSLLTTGRDLARWVTALNAGTALSRFEDETLHAAYRLADGTALTHCFGVQVHEHHGRTAIGHGGSDGGYRSYVLRMPQEHLGAIVLANDSEIDANGLAHQVADYVLGVERDTPASQPAEPQLDQYVASYQSSAGQVLTVRLWFDRLKVWDVQYGAAALYEWKGGDRFAGPDGCELEFRADELRMTGSGEPFRGTRLPPPAGEQLRPYAGRYRSAELEMTYEIRGMGDSLVAESIRQRPIRLKPTGTDFFDGREWFFSQARFVRGASGKIEGFRVSSSRAHEVLFAREAEPD